MIARDTPFSKQRKSLLFPRYMFVTDEKNWSIKKKSLVGIGKEDRVLYMACQKSSSTYLLYNIKKKAYKVNKLKKTLNIPLHLQEDSYLF